MDDKSYGHDQSFAKSESGVAIAPETLKRIVFRALDSHGAIYPISHCKNNMRDREFDMNDVIHILETGDYEEYTAEWDEDHQNWIYFVVGEDLDGERLKLLFIVEDADSRIRLISGQRFFRRKRV